MAGLISGIEKRGISLKKALLIMLCVLMSISFVACSKNDSSDLSDNKSIITSDTDKNEKKPSKQQQ